MKPKHAIDKTSGGFNVRSTPTSERAKLVKSHIESPKSSPTNKEIYDLLLALHDKQEG